MVWLRDQIVWLSHPIVVGDKTVVWGTRAIAQWVGNLPSMQMTQVQS